jgi:hypothetical protein
LLISPRARSNSKLAKPGELKLTSKANSSNAGGKTAKEKIAVKR